MELDPITKMMVVAKQQILLYQATHKERRMSSESAEDIENNTTDVTKFCMETIDIVKAKVATLEPEDKFTLLSMLENFIGKVRREASEEWTYCAHCHTYVRTSDYKIINNGDGTYNVACGNCGGYHFINKTS